jgi:hypothetical protein
LAEWLKHLAVLPKKMKERKREKRIIKYPEWKSSLKIIFSCLWNSLPLPYWFLWFWLPWQHPSVFWWF